MSDQEILKINPYLFNLITMFSSSAWCQLGKMQSTVNGKIEKDLKGAQVTIDMLIMLRDKTKGNLTEKEEEMLSSSISNLQINYADEIAKNQNQDFKIEGTNTKDKFNA
ncbi:MAG: DUF1844 domain-containing protein [Endomicrobium sp.]|jgi:hypothetical protein|nr:DUF1844 domain-containing protein [Endomicrobium sp.]